MGPCEAAAGCSWKKEATADSAYDPCQLAESEKDDDLTDSIGVVGIVLIVAGVVVIGIVWAVMCRKLQRGSSELEQHASAMPPPQIQPESESQDSKHAIRVDDDHIAAAEAELAAMTAGDPPSRP
jgi:hypothetical protein